MKNLVVGDPHAVATELEDCERLMVLVEKTAREQEVDCITILGDLYDTHNIVDVRVMEFWRRWFGSIQLPTRIRVVLGNHDQVTPTQRFPHALLAHTEDVVVCDGATMLTGSVAIIPYCHDVEEFVSLAEELSSKWSPHTLICHQTFDGSKYENGFPAKDGVPIERVPACYKTIVSGHIHTPQRVGSRVVYVGSPRWRNRNDVNVDRYLWVLEHTAEKTRPLARIPTGPHCRRLWAYDDRPDGPVDPVGYDRSKDKLWVDVYGPNEAYVRERVSEVVAKYGAVPRSFPEKSRRSVVTEAQGSAVAFKKFAEAFVPPNGTDKDSLMKMAESRLG